MSTEGKKEQAEGSEELGGEAGMVLEAWPESLWALFIMAFGQIIYVHILSSSFRNNDQSIYSLFERQLGQLLPGLLSKLICHLEYLYYTFICMVRGIIKVDFTRFNKRYMCKAYLACGPYNTTSAMPGQVYPSLVPPRPYGSRLRGPVVLQRRTSGFHGTMRAPSRPAL